jgi:site-specific recombinase XerD
MNRTIKELCAIAELKFDRKITIRRGYGKEVFKKTYALHELMTMHVARKTFISILLAKGVPPQIVMKYSGHKNLKTLQRYIDVSKEHAKTTMLNAWK